jgi:hypothetical protein
MQNSLERLLAGIAETLREVVRPALTDPYAAAQAAAAAELLENLATRVEWRRDLLAARAERVAALLRRAGRPTPTSAPAETATAAELAEALRELLAELASLQARGLPQSLAPDIEAFLRTELAEEERLVRSSMYRQRPEGREPVSGT